LRAFFPCPDCGRPSKLAESIKRVSEDIGDWKYRRYTCASGHKFSTAEQVYKAVQNRKPKFAPMEVEDD